MFDEDDYQADFQEDTNFEDVEMAYVDPQQMGGPDDDFLSDFSGAEISKWTRNSVKDELILPAKDLDFQWLDIDTFTSKPLAKNPNPGRDSILGPTSGMVPIVRIYGVTNEGNSISAFIHGFTPYGYFALPRGYEIQRDPATGKVDSNLLENIRLILNDRLKAAKRSSGNSSRGPDAGGDTLVHGVQYIDDHQSIMGFIPSHTKFLKVYVAIPTLVPALKKIIEEGLTLPGIVESASNQSSMNYNIDRHGHESFRLSPFECNVPFVLRLMVDRGITGAGWITLPKGTYSVRKRSEKLTHCQLEVDVYYNELIARESDGEWNKIAPLRVLSFDIECQGRKGYFPEADKDPVIQIANVVSVYGQSQPLTQVVFTLRGCLPIVGAHVIPSDTEEEMLVKWRAFLQVCDPDIITGYNVQNFDVPYLLDRADALSKKNKNASKKLESFKKWGRVNGEKARMRNTTFESSAYGKRNNVETTIDGRVIFDMLPYMQRNHKLSSYTLNSVCSEFLGQQKEDVHHSIISDLQNGSDADRHRLAVYCLKDAVLPLRLLEKLSVLVNYIEMARTTGVPVSYLIARGQQIKVFSMILRKCRTEKLLVPTTSRSGGASDAAGYEGATVLEPIKGYYQVPIATLDFASLYPSIMQAYNLCYSTLVNPQDVNKLNKELYKQSDSGHTFVHSQTKKGILPAILEELLSARKRAKKDMKNASTDFERAVQNGRQLALKVSANSVYGFTGAGVGQLPCLEIASSVTSYGRYLLENTKKFVEENYSVKNGYQFNAEVIYGDTDSVMVKFGTGTVHETFPLALEAAEKCSDVFPPPIKLEFEKVYFPYLLMNKKRYAGLMYTNTEKFDKMDQKGLETVRRDNCLLVRDVIQHSLDKILINQDVEGAIAFVKKQISDLLQNKMDISRLVITKSLNKGAEYALGLGGKKDDYKMKQAHVELAARMKKRDPGSAPQMGDRVPYVIITGAKGVQTYDKAEDPIYVLENSIPIDCKWYLSNQLSKPLVRIFEPILGDASDVEKHLLQGDHTRKIFIPTPTARPGSLMMFAKKMASCVGCKASIEPNTGNLCKHCLPDEALLYLQKLSALREAEVRYSHLWSEAQRVHETILSDIICTGDGCACNFYRRKKAIGDVKYAKENLDKFL